MADDYYAGEALGLPPDGPGSAARFGRRFGAYVLDTTLVTARFLPWQRAGWMVWGALAVADLVVLPWRTGSTGGKSVTGLRAVPVEDGGADLAARGLPLWSAAVRALVYPAGLLALLMDRDVRHPFDRLARTVVVRR